MGANGRPAAWVVLGLAVLFVAAGSAGCRGRAPGVPDAAKFAKAGNPLNYTAPHDGTVFVVDDWYNRVVYSGPVRQGEHVLVDPGAGTLSVGGKDVAGGRQLTKGEHSVYVKAGGGDAP